MALTIFPGRDEMVARLADHVAGQLSLALAKKGRAVFAVSGGSSPAPLYEALAQRDLGWESVTVILVDDRWVAPGADGSNDDFIRRTLLTGKAAAARFLPLKTDHETPGDGLEEMNAAYVGPAADIDVAIMGMGPDGHTASWFPHAQGLEMALDTARPVAAVKAVKSEVTGRFLHRATLSLAAIREAECSILLISGEAKKAAFDLAEGDGPVADYPVRALIRDCPNNWSCWAP